MSDEEIQIILPPKSQERVIQKKKSWPFSRWEDGVLGVSTDDTQMDEAYQQAWHKKWGDDKPMSPKKSKKLVVEPSPPQAKPKKPKTTRKLTILPASPIRAGGKRVTSGRKTTSHRKTKASTSPSIHVKSPSYRYQKPQPKVEVDDGEKKVMTDAVDKMESLMTDFRSLLNGQKQNHHESNRWLQNPAPNKAYEPSASVLAIARSTLSKDKARRKQNKAHSENLFDSRPSSSSSSL